MDSLLPAADAAAEENNNNNTNKPWTKTTSGTSGGGKKGGDGAGVMSSTDQDLAEFDKRLYGDAATWSPGEVRRWLEAEGLGKWGGVLEAGLYKCVCCFTTS
jgi:hypothetical protein